MIQRISTIVGWLALAFIAYATLSPIDARPILASIKFEHFGAYALVGLAMGLAYPRRLFWVTVIVVGSALGLEVLQLLTPDRHGRLIDALIKALGGMCGIGIAHSAMLILGARGSRARKPEAG